jgi:hypothetical protein
MPKSIKTEIVSSVFIKISLEYNYYIQIACPFNELLNHGYIMPQ